MTFVDPKDYILKVSVCYLCGLWSNKWFRSKQDQRSTDPTRYQLVRFSQLVSGSRFQSVIISFFSFVFSVSASFGPFGSYLEPFWSHLGPFGNHYIIWESFWTIWESFGIIWESLRNYLWPFVNHLEPFRSYLGPFESHFGPFRNQFGLFWSHLGSCGTILELSWTIWESFRTSLKTPGAIR